MGKGLDVEIVLERNDAIFAPLDIVRGYVEVNVQEETHIRDIKLRFRGQADVIWQQEEGTGTGITRMSTDRFIRGQEQFFDTAVTLMSGENDDKDIIIEAKKHTFPFAFRLRENLPTSFEAANGHIRYWLYVSVGIPKALSRKRRRAITVLNRVDLNNFEDISTGKTDEVEHVFGCACLHSVPLYAMIRLSKMGFVPGEALHVEAQVDNRSDVRIRQTKCVLTQIIRYHSHVDAGRSVNKIVSIPVATVVREGMGAGKSQSWKEERLRIPPIPPTSYKECKIIEIHYRLNFVIKPKRLNPKLRLSLPIVIGTIPIDGMFCNYAPPIASPAKTGLLSRAAASPFLMPLSSIGIPAPSYLESVFGKVQLKKSDTDSEEEEEERSVDFAPCYTFYAGSEPSASS